MVSKSLRLAGCAEVREAKDAHSALARVRAGMIRKSRFSFIQPARSSRSRVRRTLPESSRRPTRDDLEAFRMLVAAELVGEESAHAVGDRLRIGRLVEFEDGVHALSEFRIGQADDDAGAHIADAP